ncbi:Nif3-like dinuclear metal center hexameric protein [Amphibacillus sediminis]|uniref:Nif3-like dinuclear metal center hexameric protein n=1 Tax=Amphibacillus sediminis TaxID=360185 RepID=UPI00082B69EB|nr:Nif3-like dinuclear metal center hexameric protein [Amphibacillus sediminis]
MKIYTKDIIHSLIQPIEPIERTVDTLKFGSMEQSITGVTVTFMPTIEAIEKTIKLGANMMITHEGIFYSHWDRTNFADTWLYQKKKSLIERNQLQIFRLHDYIHQYQPDLITVGLVHALNWQNYVLKHETVAVIIELPAQTLDQIINEVKAKLELKQIKYAGDKTMTCKRIGLFVGYRGGSERTIPLINKYKLDLVIYGEGPEWETPEYLRDAHYLNQKTGLIVLGHQESESPGMQMLADQLQQKFPKLKIDYLSNPSWLKYS